MKHFLLSALAVFAVVAGVTLALSFDKEVLHAPPAPKVEEFHAFGTVRNVWDKPYASEIVFEHDNGVTKLYVFEDRVPVWAGEHVELVYTHGPYPSSHDICLYVRRLP